MSSHRIEIDRNVCKQCHNCVRVCTAPEKVLDIDEERYPRPINLDMCIQCFMCVLVCPTKALKHINPRKTLVLSREELLSI